MPQTNVNKDQSLYVIPAGDGYSTLGFKRAYDMAVSVAKWAGVDAPDPDLIGTPAGYDDYSRVMDEGYAHYQKTGERCPAELTPQLIGLEGARVEVIDKWGEKRRFQVGISTGWMPAHLEVFNRRATGGPAVSGAPFRSVTVIRAASR